MNKAEEIAKVKAEMSKQGRSFIYRQDAENDEMQKNVVFVTEIDGEEILFDAFFYTLEMEFFSNIYEEAVEMAIEKKPEYKDKDFNAIEGEHVDLMESIAEELAKDEDYQVQEFYDLEDDVEAYGVALDVCLNRAEITEKDIEEFIKKFKEGEGDVELDETFYSFSEE
ncbi:hypothetical protein V6R21_21335 [Limibacter armeniacum]|uniref:hypothetical protein n=1 Tax=Limibacter armeniacum TaxID=466084 RepID=UPI002FE66487